MAAHNIFGNKWASIAKLLPGRCATASIKQLICQHSCALVIAGAGHTEFCCRFWPRLPDMHCMGFSWF